MKILNPQLRAFTLAILLLQILLPARLCAQTPTQTLKLEYGEISSTDTELKPATSFDEKDRIYIFTEVSWDNAQQSAGKHHILYKWYTGDRLAFHFDGDKEFLFSPHQWSAWISGDHLGAGHHKVEVHIDGRLFDTREFDITVNAPKSEERLRDEIKARGRALLLKGNFEEFEKIASTYRETKERTPAGLWMLSIFYNCIKTIAPSNPQDPVWAQLKPSAMHWLQAHPNSPTAVVVAAKILSAHAWAYRGDGYAKDVKDESWQPYKMGIEQAREILDSHRDLATQDPELDALRIDVANDQNVSSDTILSMAAQALTREAHYYPIHYSAARALSPKWGGSEELVVEYIQQAIKFSKEKEGTQAYGRTYLNLLRNSPQPLDDLNLMGAKWPAMKQSFAEILQAYPDTYNLESARAMACFAGAKQDYKDYGKRKAAEGANLAWWDTADWRRGCDEWAFEDKYSIGSPIDKIHTYYTFLRGFGTKLWRNVGWIVLGAWLALETLLKLTQYLQDRTRKLEAHPLPDEPKFDPSQYPRTYRFMARSLLIGNHMAIRMLVLGITIFWLIYEFIPRDPIAAIPLISFSLLITLIGAWIIFRKFKRRVVLHTERIEVFELFSTRELRRQAIAGVKQTFHGNEPDSFILVTKPHLGGNLEIKVPKHPDLAFWYWFLSLPKLDSKS